MFKGLLIGHGASQLSEVLFDLEVFTWSESSEFSLLVLSGNFQKVADGAVDLPKLFEISQILNISLRYLFPRFRAEISKELILPVHDLFLFLSSGIDYRNRSLFSDYVNSFFEFPVHDVFNVFFLFQFIFVYYS